MIANTENSKSGIDAMSFEEALSELQSIIQQLESGEVPLEKSIEIYERGDKLCKRCDLLLRSAESKIEKLKINTDGTPSGTEPFEEASEPDPLS